MKLIENTYRDVNIALANELAILAEEVGIDVWEAIELANRHPRVNIHRLGPGPGGHRIPVDPWFLVQGTTMSRLIPLTRILNDSMVAHVLKIVKEKLADVERPVITILGLAYKGNVEDTRESPTWRLMELASLEGMEVRVYDPLAEEVKDVGLEEAVRGSDCLVLVTDHDAFNSIDPRKVGRLVRRRILIDTKNFLDAERWEKEDFRVRVLGRGR